MTTSPSHTQPSPGSENTTTGPACTKETPCFICKLKELVKSRNAGAKFQDTPFKLNFVGCRLAHRVTDVFDDRMIFFFALPSEESEKALKDGGIEEGLIKDINAAAKELNSGKTPDGQNLPWRGVRRVACNSIELEPGKPVTGHRVVAMIPITTDPGLVRLYADHKDQEAEHQKAIDALSAEIQAFEAAKKKFAETLKPNLEKAGEALKKLPAPKKGSAKTQDYVDAEKAVKAAQDAIDAQKKEVKLTKMTNEAFDKKIDELIKEKNKILEAKQAKLKQLQTDWDRHELTKGEKGGFDYRYAFRNENGDIEGDGHAFFPLGHHPDFFKFYLHHWNKDGAAPALTVGLYTGNRVLTKHVLDEDFEDLISWPISERLQGIRANLKKNLAKLADFDKQCKAAIKKREAENALALKPLKNPAEKAKLKAEQTTAMAELRATQDKERKSLLKEVYSEKDEMSNEYLSLTGVRRSGTPPPPAGTWIVMACEVEKPEGGTAPLKDEDKFVIEGDMYDKRTGREIRLHYFELKKTLKAVTIIEHFPAAEAEKLPKNSKIVAKQPMYETGGTLTPIGADDILIVQAMIGGTNVHRGHSLKTDGGNVSAKYESQKKVYNWSTGCQVSPYFNDFNLFILLCGLSKRWECLTDKSATTSECPRIKPGSATEPDPFVWEHALTSFAFPSDDLAEKINKDTKSLQKEIESSQKAVSQLIDKWYKDKAQKKIPRPAKDAEAEKTMVETYAGRIGELEQALAEEKAANEKADAVGGAKTDAEKLARAKADEAWAARKLELEKLKQEKQELDEAIAQRVDFTARKHKLQTLNAELTGFDKTRSFLDRERWLDKLQESLVAYQADETAPEALAAADSAAKSIPDELKALKKTAYERAVKMNHDWMRTCDLAYGAFNYISYGEGKKHPDVCKSVGNKCRHCGKKFSYSLIELDEKIATAEFKSIVALDTDFTKKVWKDDSKEAHPLWQGFGA